MRLLLVDDDAGFRALLRVTFELADLEVVEADGAAAADQALAEARPDVVVLDIRMPRMDGLAFCRRLKDAPATRDIPVVMLTGDDEIATEAAAYAAGADGFLRKPFRPLELVGLVEQLAHGVACRPRTTSSRHPTSSRSTPTISAACSRSSAASGGSSSGRTARPWRHSRRRSRRRTPVRTTTPSACSSSPSS
jgi:twitching motility two-component system response regulator PilH